MPLLVRNSDPLNCEAQLSTMVGGVVMSNANFYIRNHFPAPAVDANGWRLQVSGLVDRPLSLSLNDLLNMRAETMTVTLECAGNGRSFLKPAVDGEQWGLGAVSTAEWTGVPLGEVLRQAGVDPSARELVMRGADRSADPARNPNRFERSVGLDEAQSTPVLLAYAMNGEALPQQHGFPVRAIVPGWYAVNSVKWLSEIELIGHAFDGFYQTSRYIYEWRRNGAVHSEPVGRQRVRSLITQPLEGDTVAAGQMEIRGLAWSGSSAIERVDVSINQGEWHAARMVGQPQNYCWQQWELSTHLSRSGKMSIRSRATDQAGMRQPEQGEWNRLGYGNNAVQTVVVRVV
jgi:DMSO/TMAO reductase YedYZ molybdopterin-dependent catalytic subunit